MKEIDSRWVGILGAVIIHLILAIVLMSFKLRSVSVDRNDQFAIEFISEEVAPPEEEEKIELPLSAIEKILAGDDNMLNIARNLANRPDVNIDPNEYINMVKDELIQSGLLGEDNFIDAQKQLDELLTSNEEEITIPTRANDPTESQVMEANYQGPTRIFYELEGRNHTYLPIPIYKCQGSGQIVLVIEVNQQGRVTNAKINTSRSTTNDQCLIETAVNTALISRFNSSINAPKNQTGTLTYQFVAQ